MLTEQENIQAYGIFHSFLGAASAIGIVSGVTGIVFALGGKQVVLFPLFLSVVCVLIIFTISFISKGRSYGVLLCLFLGAAVFFLAVTKVMRGIYAWGRDFEVLLNQVFGTYYEHFTNAAYLKADIEMAGIVLALLLTSLVCELMLRKNLFLLTLLVFGPLCISLILSARIPVWAAVFVTIGWVAAWCFVNGPSGFRSEMILLPVLLGVIFYLLLSSGIGMQWQRLAQIYQSQVRQGIERIRFGEDTLPKGDLTKADMMLAEDKERLCLQMEEVAPIYLRGFVGSSYKDNQWHTFSSEVYKGEYQGMLSWLSEEGFYPGLQYASYQRFSTEEEAERIAVSVENIGASRRYLYLPETTGEYQAHGEWKQDWSMEASGFFGEKEYMFDYYAAQNNAEVQTTGGLYLEGDEKEEDRKRFLQAEGVYRSFVYEHYLKLNEEDKDFLNLIFFQEKTEGLYTVTSRIRTVLRILATYQEEPAHLLKGQDFLRWFLTEGKEGNAAYYASAAVLAYRAAGIPARYVEGYVLTKEQAEQEQDTTVILTGKQAHAWVEVYVDGAGWRAIEVTPGFYEEIYEANIIVAVPNEDIEGGSKEMEGLPVMEEYEAPEAAETETKPVQKKGRGSLSWLLLVIALVLVWLIVQRLKVLYWHYRYYQMTEDEQMYLLYCNIVGQMKKLYPQFSPEHPWELPAEEEFPFDLSLYQRTVRRMEKMVYGEHKPLSREIPAAEALLAQLQEALRHRRKKKER